MTDGGVGETGIEQRDPFEFELQQWVVENATPGPLPDANRGSWYCPTATESQAEALGWCRRERQVHRYRGRVAAVVRGSRRVRWR